MQVEQGARLDSRGNRVWTDLETTILRISNKRVTAHIRLLAACSLPDFCLISRFDSRRTASEFLLVGFDFHRSSILAWFTWDQIAFKYLIVYLPMPSFYVKVAFPKQKNQLQCWNFVKWLVLFMKKDPNVNKCFSAILRMHRPLKVSTSWGGMSMSFRHHPAVIDTM